MAAATQSCIALWRALFKASRMVEEKVRRSTEARGLGASDFGVLEALRERGPLPVSVLGELVALTSGSITTAVDRLSERGLVTRRSSKEDARSKLVELLPAGRQLIDCATADHAQAVTEALSALTAAERREALALLTKLIAGDSVR
jgi:MarR family 2-MHQ and catechol resistance regulon transcriptional repressor